MKDRTQSSVSLTGVLLASLVFSGVSPADTRPDISQRDRPAVRAPRVVSGTSDIRGRVLLRGTTVSCPEQTVAACLVTARTVSTSRHANGQRRALLHVKPLEFRLSPGAASRLRLSLAPRTLAALSGSRRMAGRISLQVR